MIRQLPIVESAHESSSSIKPAFPFGPFLRGPFINRWVTSCIILAFCVYRLATFVPQQLDGPNTLRPILNGWFSSFLRMYTHPDAAYEDWKQLCFLLLLIPPALALLNYVHKRKMFSLPGWIKNIFCSRVLFWASIAASLVICRYPSLLDYQLNPDEGEFLSAAHKLFYDANFFHSVDCGTSGPLNIFPLMLPAIFGLSPDFASSRVLVLAIQYGVVYLVYRSIRLLTTDDVSRIAILPLAGAFAAFRNPNFIHYSSEQIPILIVSAAVFCSVRLLRRPHANRGSLLMLGLLASAAFFSKMQAVPVVVALALGSVAYTRATGNVRSLWRATRLVIAGTLPLLIINAVLCLAAGVLKDFWISYIVSNQRYVEMQSNFITDLPRFLQYLVGTNETRFFILTFLAVMAAYAATVFRDYGREEQRAFLQLTAISAIVAGFAIASVASSSVVGSYLTLIAIFSTPLYFVLLSSRRSLGTDPVGWFGFLSALAIAAALFSIYKPHRLFPHYLLFLFTPVSMALGCILIRQADNSPTVGSRSDFPAVHDSSSQPLHSAFVMLFLLLTVASQTYVWGSNESHQFHNVVPSIREPQGDFIRSLTSKGGQITVWGWAADSYLGSGRVAATRDLNLFYFFAAPPEITRYYRARFLHDLEQHPAELFIDAVGPGSWSFTDRTLYNYEQFPEIAAFVASHYVHLNDAFEQRYFVRRDLADRARLIRPANQCAAGALRCVDAPAVQYVEDAAEASVIRSLPAIEMPPHARIEAKFTPMARQSPNATVFSNEGEPNSHLGFRFQNIGGDRYRLILGLGDSWAFSKSLLLPPNKSVSLAIELDGNDVYMSANGASVDDLHLPSPMADSPGAISIGSWINGQCRFTGSVQFFQIVDLGQSRR